MACIYNVNGFCSLYSDSRKGKTVKNSEYGYSEDDDGSCAVDEDPNPSRSCADFEDVSGDDDYDE